MNKATLHDFYGVKNDKNQEVEDKQTKWVILPEHPFKQFWEIIIFGLMIYTAVILPYRISFVNFPK